MVKIEQCYFEVQKAKKAFDNSGLSQEAAMQLARKRGATEQQIREMQQRFSDLNSGKVSDIQERQLTTLGQNIKALQGLYYPVFEIIVVNDGSKDNTLEKAINAFELEKIPYVIDYKIPTNEVLGVYKSKKSLTGINGNHYHSNDEEINPIILDTLFELFFSGISISDLSTQYNLSEISIKNNLERKGIVRFDEF